MRTMDDPISERGEILTDKVIEDLKQDLIRENIINKDQLRIAEVMAQSENEALSTVLVKLGFATEKQLASFIGERIHIPYVDIKNYTIDSKVLKLIPEKIARRYNIIPLFSVEDVLSVAMSNPLDIVSIDDLNAVAEFKVEAVITSKESINEAIDQWYDTGKDARRKLIEKLAGELTEVKRDEESQYSKITNNADLIEKANEAPIVRIVNSYITQAVLDGASDIHLEPRRDSMAVRFRIDGLLYNRQSLPVKLSASITSRIKVMTGLDISNRRTPQDGRMGVHIRNRNIDIRTSTFPSMYGENVVLRILDKTKGVPTLSELGFSNKDLNTFERLIKSTKGILLSTGPTGCGKTTTIYSAMNVLNTADKNLMTVEDPIEYEVEGVIQSQMNPKAGTNFANSLRSILRQDPDIIYIGEIRDLETAEIAVRAALTGHLVLSTLHTNDAVGAIARLLDIGIGAGLIADVVGGSFAQRLVRKICQNCRKAYQPDEDILKNLGLPLDTRFYKGEGCKVCDDIGYKGRVAIFEILVVNKDIKRLIGEKASGDEILKAAKAQGMRTLFEDGLQKVIKGITTINELERVVKETA